MALGDTSGDIFLREIEQGKAEEGSCGLGPQRACVLLLDSLGAESSWLSPYSEGPVLCPKTTRRTRIQFGRGTLCLSILSLNLITHARAFQAFGCKFLEIRLIFSDIFIPGHLVCMGAGVAERWSDTQSDGDYSSRNWNAAGKIVERHKKRSCGKTQFLELDTPAWHFQTCRSRMCGPGQVTWCFCNVSFIFWNLY